MMNDELRPRSSSFIIHRSSFLAIVLTWAISTLMWFTPGLTKPDGAGYYVYLVSSYFDRDLLFFDEWQQLGMVPNGRILHKEITATDHLGNHWTVGSAMYWFPSFVAGDALRVLPPLRRFPRNGFSLPFNVPVAFASAVAGLLTLLVGYSMARRITTPFAAALSAIAIWFGTPLMWYSLRSSVMSHAVSALACALSFALAWRLRSKAELAGWALAGFAAGFAFAVRPQNAPIALLPLFFARPDARRALAYSGAAALAVTPQLMVSFTIYGNPLAFLWGGGAQPFAAFERIWWWEPLLSWYHGLIPWSPICAIGLAGLFLLYRRERGLALAGLYLFLTQWIINAVFERSFWGAFSFGQRRFDNCTIVFLLGAAVLFASLPRWMSAILAVLCSAWTLSLFAGAQHGLDLSRYFTPGELFRFQVDGLSNLRFVALGAVPPAMRATVLLAMAMAALLWIAILLLARRISVRRGALLAGGYFLLMIVWFAASGSRRNLPSHAGLIASNRGLARIPGGADVRTELLEDELEYLRKAGRHRLAAVTERELAELIRARRAAEGQRD